MSFTKDFIQTLMEKYSTVVNLEAVWETVEDAKDEGESLELMIINISYSIARSISALNGDIGDEDMAPIRKDLWAYINTC